MKKILTCMVFVAYIAMNSDAASMMNLFSDHRAMRIDDIVTVIIDESAKAGSESGTTTSKENSMGVEGSGGSGALRFIPGLSLSGGSRVDYDGKGGTSRQGSLIATISARVIQVLDNGNLVIEGSKEVEINNEKELIRLTGMVRPQDIKKNNIIYSSSIADAQITYSGSGNASTGKRPGLFARFLNWIF